MSTKRGIVIYYATEIRNMLILPTMGPPTTPVAVSGNTMKRFPGAPDIPTGAEADGRFIVYWPDFLTIRMPCRVSGESNILVGNRGRAPVNIAE
jgi:hypothetical protein